MKKSVDAVAIVDALSAKYMALGLMTIDITVRMFMVHTIILR
jgi:hypothetical protein